MKFDAKMCCWFQRVSGLLRGFLKTSRYSKHRADEIKDFLAESKHPKWPVDSSKRECHRRNDVFQSYIRGRDWCVSSEFHLLRKLVLNPASVTKWNEYYNEYPYIFDYEWECSVGRGDLVCTDGKNCFLVVELKSLHTDGYGSGRTRRTKKRQKLRHGEGQTEKFATFWHDMNPQVQKTTGIFITEESIETLIELKR